MELEEGLIDRHNQGVKDELAHAPTDDAGREGLATIWNLAADYDRHELCELVGNMADYYVQGITEPVDEWLFEPASASHADTIDLTR